MAELLLEVFMILLNRNRGTGPGILEWVPCAWLMILIILGVGDPAQAIKPHPKWPPADSLFYYGPLADPAVQDQAAGFDLAVVHPDRDMSNLTADRVKRIQLGLDGMPGTADDTMVIAYITIGEDDNPPGGPPRRNDGQGPCYFVEGKGLMPSNQGYPKRFLDERSQRREDPVYRKLLGKKGGQATGRDGLPDENSNWRSYYVNPGDPQWRRIVFERLETMAATGVDGFFLDTIGTCSPWGKYAYLQKPMAKLVADIHQKYPQHYLIANRGFFLLNNRTPEFGRSIDGLLFENFLTEWDDEEEKGIISPYLDGNLKVLRNQLRDVSPGIHLLFLDYVALEQPELMFLVLTQRSLLRGLPAYTVAFGEPSLQKIYPRWTEFINGGADGQLPSIESMKLEATGGGEFLVHIQVDRKPGPGTLLDFRYSRDPSATDCNPRFPYLPLTLVQEEKNRTGFLLTYQGEGVNRNTQYRVWARFIGPGVNSRENFVTGHLSVPDGSWPDAVEKFKVWREDSRVLINWETSGSGADHYRIRGGPVGSEETILLEVKAPPVHVDRLQNGTRYRFRMQAVSSQGVSGPLTPPRVVIPKDGHPEEDGRLAPVEGVQVEAGNGTIQVCWKPLATNLRGYRVYIIPVKEKYRLPLFTRENFVVTEPALPGKYRVFVTAVNWEREEGPLSSAVTVTVKP